MSIFVWNEEESKGTQCNEEDASSGKTEAHLTTSSSQGIMGITWAQNGLATAVMGAAMQKDMADLARGTWLDGRVS